MPGAYARPRDDLRQRARQSNCASRVLNLAAAAEVNSHLQFAPARHRTHVNAMADGDMP